MSMLGLQKIPLRTSVGGRPTARDLFWHLCRSLSKDLIALDPEKAGKVEQSGIFGGGKERKKLILLKGYTVLIYDLC